MLTLKEIKKNLEAVSVIKNVVLTYQEIANLKMKKIREKAFKNREFFDQLLEIYKRVKTAFLFFKKNKGQKDYFLSAKKERVVVFLSANHLFYGGLMSEIWSKIFSFFQVNKADLAIVGRVGQHLVEGFGVKKFFFFELDDDQPEEKNVEKIVSFIKQYKEIIVFYGRYKNVLSQEVVASKITELEIGKKGESKQYIFEPSPEAIVEFFEREIIATLFHQCLLEHQLARYASRVIAMYQATEKAKETERKLIAKMRKLKKQSATKKQIELFGKISI